MTQSPNRFTNRADLLIAAGESIKMQTAAGLDRIHFKFQGQEDSALISYGFNSFPRSYLDYEFPIAVVEGKPVFVGDELFYKDDGLKCTVISGDGLKIVVDTHTARYRQCTEQTEALSWNPPKPAIVTVPLLREDAQSLQDWIIAKDAAQERVMNSIREALEK